VSGGRREEVMGGRRKGWRKSSELRG